MPPPLSAFLWPSTTPVAGRIEFRRTRVSQYENCRTRFFIQKVSQYFSSFYVGSSGIRPIIQYFEEGDGCTKADDGRSSV